MEGFMVAVIITSVSITVYSHVAAWLTRRTCQRLSEENSVLRRTMEYTKQMLTEDQAGSVEHFYSTSLEEYETWLKKQ
jgi:hypothetical protein